MNPTLHGDDGLSNEHIATGNFKYLSCAFLKMIWLNMDVGLLERQRRLKIMSTSLLSFLSSSPPRRRIERQVGANYHQADRTINPCCM